VGSAGSAVAAVGSAGSAAAGSGSAAVPAVAFTKVSIDSRPPGAAIIINGVTMAKRTNGGAFNLPRDGAHPLIILHLHGYEDYAIRDVVLDRDAITKTVVLKKLAPAVHHGGGAGSAKGSDTSKPDDTSLMKPDDL
jgi:hypothetical protein